MESGNKYLPFEMIHRITYPFARFIKIEALAGVALLVATVLSVALTNSTWSESFQAIWELQIGFQIGTIEVFHSARKWINDGLMTFFFFVVALELKREVVLGELRKLRMALLPLAGAIGGMLFPALFYLGVIGQLPERHGWGIVMATDTAFVIGCLSLLGSRVPSNLRLFLLSLAIFDDVGAILVVALGYGTSLNLMPLFAGVLGLCGVAIMASAGIRSIPFYSVIGLCIWAGLEASGLHPTVSGVILGLMTPAYSWISDMRLRAIFGKILSYKQGENGSESIANHDELQIARTAAKEAVSPIERITIKLHPWVGFVILPLFALANAGVEISSDTIGEPLSLAIIMGLVLGKPLGVFTMTWLIVKIGFATLLENLNWPLVFAGSLLTGIGFTMSIFIAGLALNPESLRIAKNGILIASSISGFVGVSVLFILTSKKSGRSP